MAIRPWLESRQSAGAAYSPKIMDFYADKAVAAMVERFEPEALADGLARFLHLYKTSPIPDNTGGMGFWHGFALFTFLEILRPKAVVESGVYRGFSTWLIETLAPEARILSIDPALGQRLYISQSKNVTYSNIDFRYQDFLEFEGFDRSDVLVLFDDHNNHMDRLSHMLYHGFTQAIFDDNYYPSGDCLGMKKIIHGGAYNPHAVFGAFDNTANLMLMREGLFLSDSAKAFGPLCEKLSAYMEFPAPFLDAAGRFGQVQPMFSAAEEPGFKTLPQALQDHIVATGFAFPTYVRVNTL